MNKYLKRLVCISVIVLAFFLVLSLITNKWGFFFWSLLYVFMVLMTGFFTEKYRENKNE